MNDFTAACMAVCGPDCMTYTKMKQTRKIIRSACEKTPDQNVLQVFLKKQTKKHKQMQAHRYSNLIVFTCQQQLIPETNKSGEQCFGTDTKESTDTAWKETPCSLQGKKTVGGREACGNLLNARTTATQNITQHYSHNSCKWTILYWHILLNYTNCCGYHCNTVTTLH